MRIVKCKPVMRTVSEISGNKVKEKSSPVIRLIVSTGKQIAKVGSASGMFSINQYILENNTVFTSALSHN